MHIETFQYNDFSEDFASNTYVVYNDNNEAVVIDPSKRYEGIHRYLEKHDLKLKGIFLTHGHIDHMRGIEVLLNHYNVSVYMHFLDKEHLTNPDYNCSSYIDEKDETFLFTPSFVSDEQTLNVLKGLSIKVIHTPFHTQGSVCFYFKEINSLFSGDSLFQSGIGRTDLPGGNTRQIKESLRKIFALPEETTVYPGHGPKTTIGHEKQVNCSFNF